MRFFLLAGSASAALAAYAPATAEAPARPAAERELVILPPAELTTRLNPSGRTISFTLPFRDGGTYLGDVLVEIGPDDTLKLSSARVVELLARLLSKEQVEALRSDPQVTAEDLAKAGVSLRFNAQELALDVELAMDRRAARTIAVSGSDEEEVGEFVTPANFSAFLNMRGNLDHLHGSGLESPVVYLDGAARFGSIVAESDGIWKPGGDGPSWYRGGSRLIYDDRDRLIRWTAGDLQTVGRGFQSSPEIAGLSIFRSYGVLEPQRIARPRGDRSFSLTRSSTIEVQVNGQLVRRLQLQPGNYDLRDFPFTQGSNDVRLVILDDSGRSQVLSFNIFLDQTQLGQGLTEFGLYAGVLASTGLRGPDYSGDAAASGFVRHGLTDRLTVGGNIQGDRRSQMGGVEALWSTPFGALAGTLSLSHLRDRGMGNAMTVTFQRLVRQGDGGSDALNLFVERRSKNFGVLGTVQPTNPFAWEAGGGYSRSITSDVFVGIDGRYSRGRGDQPDIYTARGTLSARLSSSLSLGGEVRWEKDNFERRLSGLITATMRLGRYSSARAEYDTRFDRARLSYTTFRGTGVGAYNFNADIDRSEAGSGVNVTGNYFGNRGEIGLSHFGSFDNLFSDSLSQRSSARLATSLALADGSFSIGRPIYDSFAIVRGHRSLKKVNVEVEPTSFGRIADTGLLGTAVHPQLASYLNRTVTVDAPEAPATADLGQGSFRLFPAYRSGYLLTVGSAFNVTAIGTLKDAEGKPLSLASGTVRPLGNAESEAIAIFTNRQGRFGAVGLGPGRWQVQMNDEAKSIFIIDVPKNAEGVITVGELSPASRTQ